MKFSWVAAAALAMLAAFPAWAQDEPVLAPDDDAAAENANAAKAGEDSPYENMHVLARAMQLIRQDYVDAKKISYRDLTYSALRGMLSNSIRTARSWIRATSRACRRIRRASLAAWRDRDGEDNLLTVIGIVEGTPGFEAGLQPGDQIRKINGLSTDRMTMADAVDMLRGEPGEKVTLTISRPPTNELKEFTIARAVIKVPSVVDAMVLPTSRTGGRKIGYLRLTQFNEPTARELSEALDKLDKQGIEALVMDLRFNPGGLLTSAVDVCSQFVPPNTRDVYTEGRTPTRDYYTRSFANGPRKYPLATSSMARARAARRLSPAR